ncbi:MAG: hypothetical protein JNL61_01340 [Rhizobiaceae bacterium]|nr:hypothetical protein [Rhizobiaceae bacterium]
MIGEYWPWSQPSGSLADFQPLLPAEAEVVAHLSSGDFDRVGDGSRPETDEPARRIRASFLRFLILGGDENSRPHEKGIRLSGAWITGVLDLEACRTFRDIGLKDCRFDSVPVLRSAIINRVFLDGSSLPGLQAERLEVRGGLYLRGAKVTGEVNLVSSRLGGNVECDGALIEVPRGGVAVWAESVEARSILFRGAEIRGGVNLSGADLQADLDLAGAKVARPGDVAINVVAIEVAGSVVLRSAAVEGEVRMTGSRVGADMDFTAATVANAGKAAVDMSRTTVTGAFFLRKGAAIDGLLDMSGASVGTIHDEQACWPGRGDLALNRCQYGAFIDGPVRARERLDWLSRQTPERWKEDFWPQPYEQLANVFQHMGHDEDARAVLIVKERLQRRARRQRARNPVILWWRRVLDWVLAVTIAYGRQPLLAFVWLTLFWLIGVGVFWFGERHSTFKPNSAVVLRSPEWNLCGMPTTEQRFLASTQAMAYGRAAEGQTQLNCFREQWEAASYPELVPPMYSLDTLLPVLDMDQKSYWRPDPSKPYGRMVLAYFYFQSVIGWALSLLAVAGFSGLVKSR